MWDDACASDASSDASDMSDVSSDGEVGGRLLSRQQQAKRRSQQWEDDESSGGGDDDGDNSSSDGGPPSKRRKTVGAAADDDTDVLAELSRAAPARPAAPRPPVPALVSPLNYPAPSSTMTTQPPRRVAFDLRPSRAAGDDSDDDILGDLMMDAGGTGEGGGSMPPPPPPAAGGQKQRAEDTATSMPPPQGMRSCLKLTTTLSGAGLGAGGSSVLDSLAPGASADMDAFTAAMRRKAAALSVGDSKPSVDDAFDVFGDDSDDVTAATSGAGSLLDAGAATDTASFAAMMMKKTAAGRLGAGAGNAPPMDDAFDVFGDDDNAPKLGEGAEPAVVAPPPSSDDPFDIFGDSSCGGSGADTARSADASVPAARSWSAGFGSFKKAKHGDATRELGGDSLTGLGATATATDGGSTRSQPPAAPSWSAGFGRFKKATPGDDLRVLGGDTMGGLGAGEGAGGSLPQPAKSDSGAAVAAAVGAPASATRFAKAEPSPEGGERADKNTAAAPLQRQQRAAAPLPAAVEALKQDGNRLVARRQFEDAATAYTKALNELPSPAFELADDDGTGAVPDHGDDLYFEGRSVLLSNRSHALCSLGLYKRAFADAVGAVRAHPAWFKGYIRKAAVLQALGEWDAATTTLEAGLAHTSPDEASYATVNTQLRGVVAAKAKAAGASSGGVSCPPEQRRFYDTFLAEMRDGTASFQRRDFSAALSHYSRAVRCDSANHVVRCNRAAAAIHMQNYTEALKDAELAIAFHPKHAKGYLRKAAALKGRQQLAEALNVIDAALAKVGGDAQAFAPLAALRDEIHGIRKKRDASLQSMVK